MSTEQDSQNVAKSALNNGVNARTHIVIVNYNAGDWLPRSVQSALDYSDGLVTVVDNNSSDDSVALTQSTVKDTRLNWVLNSNNTGFAAANNQVLKCLDHEFAVLMNPDCELKPQAINRLIEGFDQHQEMGLASCKILNSDGTIQSTCRRKFPTPWSALVRMAQLHRLFPNNPRFANFDYGDQIEQSEDVEFIEAISGAFMVVRKTALDEVGLLDEEYFMHCEDLDWCKRFEIKQWAVGFLANVSVVHAKGVSSQSRPIGVLLTLHKGMNRFFNKFYTQGQPFWLIGIVKLGIVVSFIARCGLSLVRGFAKSVLKGGD